MQNIITVHARRLAQHLAKKSLLLIVGAGVGAFATTASAQSASASFPTQPIKLIIPSSAGGLPDTLARLIAPHMSHKLGQQVLVENRTGAGGIIAADSVAKAPPDGHTIFVGDQGQLAVNPILYKKIPYSPSTDFAPIGLVGTSPLFLIAHPSVPGNNFKEFVAAAKAAPKKYSFGSTGIGSIHHLATESLTRVAGIDLIHVPYRGSGQSSPALAAGEISVLLVALPSAAGFLKSGQAKMLGASTLKRSPQSPDVPTLAEQGAPGFDFTADIGLLAPKGTPANVIAKLSEAMMEAVRQDDVKARLAVLGIDGVGSTTEQYRAHLEREAKKYGDAVKAAGLVGAN